MLLDVSHGCDADIGTCIAETQAGILGASLGVNTHQTGTFPRTVVTPDPPEERLSASNP